GDKADGTALPNGPPIRRRFSSPRHRSHSLSSFPVLRSHQRARPSPQGTATVLPSRQSTRPCVIRSCPRQRLRSFPVAASQVHSSCPSTVTSILPSIEKTGQLVPSFPLPRRTWSFLPVSASHR